MRQAVILTGHQAGSGLKATVPFMADVLAGSGWNVSMVTVGYSWLSALKGQRWNVPVNRWYGTSNPYLRGYVWLAPFHPLHPRGRVFNALTTPLFHLYPWLLPESIRAALQQAELIIIESGFGVMLAPLVKRLNPKARLVYEGSDMLTTLGFHPVVIKAEQKVLPLFHLVSIPARAIADSYPQGLKNLHVIPQGLEKAAFDHKNPNPYKSTKNVVSVGDMLFDAWAVQTLAEQFPDWNFHLFGEKARLQSVLPNVTAYGQVAFEELVPYIQHADVGLAPYRPAPGCAYLSQSSLKLLQYSYCRLPVVAPVFAAAARRNVCGYQPGEKASLQSAFNQAITYQRGSIDTADILSWNEVVARILKEAKAA